ncbi:hypothetical protein BDN72DRAFT_838117 [Pluteus cervinus]|uniref:Uncharacterized protein n=1 Tax=Pluteus cervinus TaxID=181527 RepID=A0ACD3B1Q9_9AGAR|nr:hypothetical protein BDN72DRAFT_838117 [Pluteus cervinus]
MWSWGTVDQGYPSPMVSEIHLRRERTEEAHPLAMVRVDGVFSISYFVWNGWSPVRSRAWR